MKNYTEKRLADFDKLMDKLWDRYGESYEVYNPKEFTGEIKDFLATSINQAIAEERDRLVREARQTLKKEDSDIVERVIASLYKPVTKKD